MSSSIERELQRDERLLWKGSPRGGIRLRGADAYLIPFSMLWAGFAMFWEYMVLLHAPRLNPAGWFPPLFGMVFVIVGLYILIGRFFVDAKVRERTEYALTDRRAIIVSGLFSKSVRSIDLKATPEIALAEKSDGSGTITFGPAPTYGRWQYNPWLPASSGQPAFDMIDDVRKVYAMIEQAKGR